MRKNRRRRKKKNPEMKIRNNPEGSLTVEAALVMPVILFVIVLAVYYLFFLYNRSVLADAACLAVKQTAYYGSESNREIEKHVKEKCEEALCGRMVAVKRININTSVGKFQSKVILTAEMNLPEDGILGYILPLSEIKVCAKSDRLQPAGVIRLARKGKTVKEWFTKSEEEKDEGSIQTGYELQLFDSSAGMQLLPDHNVLQE